MLTASAAPIVSVVVVSFRPGAAILGCLASLADQQTSSSFETIVVDSSHDGTATAVRERFPGARVHSFESRLFPGAARNVGVAAARGRIVAFLDADCVAMPDWIEVIVEAHRSHPAVGGPIANANPESTIGWAAYLCEFSEWMPGGRARYLRDMATANASYDTEVLRDLGPFLEGAYGSDSDLHARLADRGVRIRFEPSVRVAHRNLATIRAYLRHEFHHGRDYARVRSRRLGILRRSLLTVSLPAVLCRVLLKRIGQNIRNPTHLGRLVAVFPLLFAGLLAWCVGESVGYLRGAHEG